MLLPVANEKEKKKKISNLKFEIRITFPTTLRAQVTRACIQWSQSCVSLKAVRLTKVDGPSTCMAGEKSY